MAYWISRAGQFYYALAGIIRPRSINDQMVIGATQQGTPTAGSAHLSVDAGTANEKAINTRGVIQSSGLFVDAGATCCPGILLTESANDFTCSGVWALAASGGTLSNAAIYIKNNQLVVAYLCGANGQVRYASLTLDGFTCTWSTRSVGP